MLVVLHFLTFDCVPSMSTRCPFDVYFLTDTHSKKVPSTGNVYGRADASAPVVTRHNARSLATGYAAPGCLSRWDSDTGRVTTSPTLQWRSPHDALDEQPPSDGFVDMSMLDVQFHTQPFNAVDLAGSLDLSARQSWGEALRMPACSIKSAIVLDAWTWALLSAKHSAEKGNLKIWCQLNDGTTCTGMTSVDFAIALGMQLEQQIRSEKLSTPDTEGHLACTPHQYFEWRA